MIMDPPGVFIVFTILHDFNTHTQIQIIEQMVAAIFSALAGTRSWDLGDVLGFSSYL